MERIRIKDIASRAGGILIMKTKICKKCGLFKSLNDEFYKSYLGHYSSQCKKCDIKKSKEYAKKNRDKANRYHNNWRRKHENTPHLKSQQILDGMRRSSKKKGFKAPEWKKNEIEEIITNGRCAITNIPFEFSQKEFSKSPWTPSPDRIDNNYGYSEQNTQWVCHMYNMMKSEYDSLIIIKFITEVYKNLHKI